MREEDYFYIALADDDEDDRLLFIDAFEELTIQTKVKTYKDGIELLKSFQCLNAKLPDLLFLDLKMPKKSGFDCLLELRQNPRFMTLPIAIYSTFDTEAYVNQAYNYGANIYIQKPCDFIKIKKTLSEVVQNYLSFSIKETRENFVFHL